MLQQKDTKKTSQSKSPDGVVKMCEMGWGAEIVKAFLQGWEGLKLSEQEDFFWVDWNAQRDIL